MVPLSEWIVCTHIFTSYRILILRCVVRLKVLHFSHFHTLFKFVFWGGGYCPLNGLYPYLFISSVGVVISFFTVKIRYSRMTPFPRSRVTLLHARAQDLRHGNTDCHLCLPQNAHLWIEAMRPSSLLSTSDCAIKEVGLKSGSLNRHIQTGSLYLFIYYLYGSLESQSCASLGEVWDVH